MYLLKQINNVRNQTGRILDLVLADDNLANLMTVKQSNSTTYLLPADNYHPPQVICVKMEKTSAPRACSNSNQRKLNFFKANYTALNTEIANTNFNFLYGEGITIDDAVLKFNETLTNFISKTVPQKNKPRKPPWGNRLLADMKRRSKTALRNFERHNTVTNREQHRIASRRYRAYNRMLHENYITRVQNNLRRNPRAFWSYIDSKRNNRQSITVLSYNGTMELFVALVYVFGAATRKALFCS